MHFHWIMTAALPAFLLESFFYLATVFEGTRRWLQRSTNGCALSALLWSSALLPFLVFSLAADTFQLRLFLLLAGYSAVIAFWYVLVPKRFTYDIGFIVVAAAPVLLRVFKRIYLTPDSHLRVDILGHLMVIRLAVAALLILRLWNPGPLGLWPKLDEWRIGAIHYCLVMIPLALVALSLGAVKFAPAHGGWWRVAGLTVGTFFGSLWVVAFSEELLFRGVIERALLGRWRSPLPAILISAILYSVVHLWFRHFPDWQWMLITVVLGLACGSAYLRSGSIRAPMVTHALVVTTWRLLFTS